MAKAKSTKWTVLAPFGRLGHALGWRWAMPIGTLPLPYHPWIARFGPWLIVALLIAYPLARSIEAGHALALAQGWARPLWIALGLAIPLSVPILQWLAFLFRLPLLQLVMAPVAMLLLTGAVVTGAEPAAMMALPATYFGWHMAGAIRGALVLRRLHDRAAELERTIRLGAVDDPPILIDDQSGAGDRASWLARTVIDKLNQPFVHMRGIDRKTGEPVLSTWYRVAAGDFEAIEALAADIPECGVQRGKQSPTVIVRLTGDPPQGPVTELIFGDRSMRWMPLKGKLSNLTIARPGLPAIDYVHGVAARYAWVPGFSLFYMFSLTGQGRWQFGFPHKTEEPVGQARTVESALATLAAPVDGEPPRCIDLSWLQSVLDARLTTMLAEECESLDRLLVDPEHWRLRHFRQLPRRPDLIAAHAETIWAALISSRDNRWVHATRALAALVAELPEREFRALGPDIVALLNSREVAGQARTIKLSRADLKAGDFPFAGFGLLSFTPKLYERLGELGEPARPLIMALGTLANWPSALAKARDRLG
ncbi:hypothetical protein [Sphingomonas colocasiae]|uniref:Uncharacterized protein n=1 Tax=Sphingomonas colocasiae TaxID=1848973 RepID=A0ABS7PNW1_9SPHN|nr:hypothetical protein [Sphingomonas colocasiae]MBY8822997.1 hypothetical protein [Sphingomonas colocasiae]